MSSSATSMRILSPRRRALPALLAGAVSVMAALCAAPGAWAQGPKSAVNLAMVGEPPSLDPMQATTDLVGTIMQHVYEPLYTFDAKWNIVPMLAEAMPVVSADGKTVRLTLRKGVKLHTGRLLDAQDVVVSLKRWMKEAPRGKAVAKELDDLKTVGELGVEFTLKAPYPPLLSQLALPSGMAAIMARESAAQPLRDFVGTGPYRLKERRTDQFVVLTRFEGYSARKEPASGYGGKREALIEELRFVPVPSPHTRVEGALSGQFHFADLLPVEALAKLEKSGGKAVPVITPAFGFPYLVFNTREGVNANKGVRQALQTAIGPGEMFSAAFGDARFYQLEPSHFPQGSPFFSAAGGENYNQRDAGKARAQAEAAGYKGEPIRVLTSRQYDFHYNMALVMAEQLKRAGFKPELQVVDWATLVQRRNDSSLWDIYVTHSGLLPEPMLSPPQLGDGAPGWWSTPAKQVALAEFNHITVPARRAQAWAKVQQLVYDEVPYMNLGKFNSLSARSPRLEGFQPALWPFFWNARLVN